jgi:hypothetical protein
MTGALAVESWRFESAWTAKTPPTMSKTIVATAPVRTPVRRSDGFPTAGGAAVGGAAGWAGHRCVCAGSGPAGGPMVLGGGSVGRVPTNRPVGPVMAPRAAAAISTVHG